MKQGYSRTVIGNNIAMLVREGMPQKQAIALSLDSARKAWKRRYPAKEYPAGIKRNPDPRDLERASKLYEDFSGHDAQVIGTAEKMSVPDTMLVIGELRGILYHTTRDGKASDYLHKFRKNSRPLLCVAPDGLQLFILGGSYEFTDAGIEDRG